MSHFLMITAYYDSTTVEFSSSSIKACSYLKQCLYGCAQPTGKSSREPKDDNLCTWHQRKTMQKVESRKALTYTVLYDSIYQMSLFGDGSMSIEDDDPWFFRCLPRWMHGVR